MDLRRIAPIGGAVACLLTALVVIVPFLAIEGQGQLVSDYYSAGPIGAGGIVFLALLGVVIFLSGERGAADRETIAGVSLVLSVTIFAIAVIWWLSISNTLLFSFPSEYNWIQNHPPAVVATTLLVVLAGAGYAKAILD